MLDRLSRRAYASLGSRYPVAVVGVGVVETVFVAVVSVLVLGLFFRPDLGAVLAVAGLAALLTATSVSLAAWRARDERCRLGDWMRLSRPTPRESVEAWDIATTLTLEQYRRSSPVVMAVSIVPTAVALSLIHI